jgi:transposase
MTSMQIGVDLAKSVFEIALSTRPGQVADRRRLSRVGFQRLLATCAPAQVVMEACGSAHYWGRELTRLGHEVTLLHPGDAARYRDGNKTDRADAKALLEAARNTALHPVPVKSTEQQALEALLTEIATLETLAAARRDDLARLGKLMPAVAWLQTVPGVGVLTATALVAFVGDVRRFRSGRDFAAYLGLTPREYSSGAVRRLGRITKRGNSYLRMLLIHGARAALRAGQLSAEPDALRVWAVRLANAKGHNVAAVALANKLARICWRVCRDQRPFERRTVA